MFKRTIALALIGIMLTGCQSFPNNSFGPNTGDEENDSVKISADASSNASSNTDSDNLIAVPVDNNTILGGSNDNTCIEPTGDLINDAMCTVKKPVIYLDGYENKDVEVKLTFKGDITMTYPSIDKDTSSWKVKVDEKGNILASGEKYRYLFWEGKVDNTWDFTKGFCIEGKETVSFLNEQLKKMGMKPQEIQDFITYWAPEMIDNKYNIISFQTTKYKDVAELKVTPAPKTLLRVYMAWYPSDEAKKLTAQSFKTPSRDGRTVVEWGGTKVVKEEPKPDVASSSAVQTQASNTPAQTTDDKKDKSTSSSQIVAPTPAPAPAPVDPYAQYGSQAQCAKDWDATAAKKCGKTWAQLDAGTRGAAWNHWQGHGSAGW